MKPRRRHWKQANGRVHDGFSLVNREGRWGFMEGRATSDHLLTYQEYRNLNACARKRGIGGGFFVIDNPRENNCHEPPTTRYNL